MLHSFEDKTPRIHESVFIAWNAEVAGDAEIDEGCSIWYGAVIRADVGPARIGPRSNIQDGAVIHVDRDRPCILGTGVTVGHRAILHACTVGDHALVGMGAIVLDGAEIGAESIVGAGALVTQGKKFPPRSMILGSPAKLVRELSEDEARGLREHAEAYAELARRTAAGSQEA